MFNTYASATEAPFRVNIPRGRGWPLQPSVGALPWTPFGYRFCAQNLQIYVSMR